MVLVSTRGGSEPGWELSHCGFNGRSRDSMEAATSSLSRCLVTVYKSGEVWLFKRGAARAAGLASVVPEPHHHHS